MYIKFCEILLAAQSGAFITCVTNDIENSVVIRNKRFSTFFYEISVICYIGKLGWVDIPVVQALIVLIVSLLILKK